MLGLNPGVAPKFVKLYGDLGAQIEKSVADYADEVRHRSFPGEDHIYR
jgi:3-methyl-2-oxobutanoate hydroxymethyltransferase